MLLQPMDLNCLGPLIQLLFFAGRLEEESNARTAAEKQVRSLESQLADLQDDLDSGRDAHQKSEKQRRQLQDVSIRRAACSSQHMDMRNINAGYCVYHSQTLKATMHSITMTLISLWVSLWNLSGFLNMN